MTNRAGAAPGLLLALAVLGALQASAQFLRATTEPPRALAETVLENALANLYADGYRRVRHDA